MSEPTQVQSPYCNGEGEIIEADRFADEEGRRRIQHIKCEYCQGDGWIIQKKTKGNMMNEPTKEEMLDWLKAVFNIVLAMRFLDLDARIYHSIRRLIEKTAVPRKFIGGHRD